MALKLITPPATYPVTLAEAKAQCRVLDGDEDTYLNTLIAAATSYVENHIERSLIEQTWELHLDEFSSSIELPRGPVSSISSVKYYDSDDVLQTIDADNYAADLISDPQWIVPVSDYSWPTPATGINNVIITYVAGYATLPESIRMAILLLVSTWFDRREATADKGVGEVPYAVRSLLNQHAVWAV